jgi:hypothetical protein
MYPGGESPRPHTDIDTLADWQVSTYGRPDTEPIPATEAALSVEEMYPFPSRYGCGIRFGTPVPVRRL